MQLTTIQPSEFANRLYFNRKLTPGLKLKSKSTGKTYILEGLDEKQSQEEGVFCYIIKEVKRIRDLFLGVEFEVVGYKPEYELNLKETLFVAEEKVDNYLENLKHNNKMEREYRQFKATKEFDLSGSWVLDRHHFNYR